MSLHELDRALARLREAADTVGANLVELEREPYHKLLEHASLVGESAARWSEAKKALSDLWQWFALFNRLIERATDLRGTGTRLSSEDEARLEALLNGPSIEFDSTTIPIGRRDLLGLRTSATHCTPDELLGRMSTAFDCVKLVLTSIGQAWDVSMPRITAAETRLTELTQLATSVGEEAMPELPALREGLARLSDAIIKDPLSLQISDLDLIERQLESLRDDLDAAAQLRADVASQFDHARATLDELEGAADEAARAHRETVGKIVSPDVPEPLEVDREIIRQLEIAEGLSRKGRWREAQSELADWKRQAEDALRLLTANVAANRLPIEERNQLRGLLDAYRAKIHRLGLIEEPSLTSLYDAAREALYTAPTNLREAAGLVRRYQRAVPAERPRGVEK